MQEITSRQNKSYQLWYDLLESKGVQTHQRAILAGKKIILDTLQRHLNHVSALLVPDEAPEKLSSMMSDKAFFMASKIPQYLIKKELFKGLDISGTGFPLLVVQVPVFKKVEKLESVNGAALYLPFQDPKNVCAVLRSAAAFGVSQIFLGQGCAHPFHPQSSRAASGCLFDHKFYRIENLNSIEPSVQTIALDLKGESLAKFKFPKNFLLIPGVEGAGVSGIGMTSREAGSGGTVGTGDGLRSFEPKHRVYIPMTDKAESLNAAQATTVALYQWFSSHNLGL
jgi:TrmH family RNA methyltransferase